MIGAVEFAISEPVRTAAALLWLVMIVQIALIPFFWFWVSPLPPVLFYAWAREHLDSRAALTAVCILFTLAYVQALYYGAIYFARLLVFLNEYLEL